MKEFIILSEPSFSDFPLIGGTVKYLNARKEWAEKMIVELEKEINFIEGILNK